MSCPDTLFREGALEVLEHCVARTVEDTGRLDLEPWVAIDSARNLYHQRGAAGILQNEPCPLGTVQHCLAGRESDAIPRSATGRGEGRHEALLVLLAYSEKQAIAERDRLGNGCGALKLPKSADGVAGGEDHEWPLRQGEEGVALDGFDRESGVQRTSDMLKVREEAGDRLDHERARG
jgi:hypothetical protein